MKAREQIAAAAEANGWTLKTQNQSVDVYGRGDLLVSVQFSRSGAVTWTEHRTVGNRRDVDHAEGRGKREQVPSWLEAA